MQGENPHEDGVNSSAPLSPLIVHVVRQYAPSRGGLEDVVANLSANLQHHGYRVRVVTLDRLFRQPEKTLPKWEQVGSVGVVRLPWRGSSRYPIAPQVFRHIRDADLVHVHGVDFFFDALAWTRMLHGKPLVATTHGGFFHTKKYAALKRIWFSTATRLSATGYQSVICCSQSDLEMFQPIAAGRAVMIENGVDVAKFVDAASREPRRSIVTVGRFSSNKRLDHLLDSLSVLVQRDRQWHLDIVGAPSDWTETDIAENVKRRALDQHVSVHVGLENDQIRSLLARNSLFASASDYEGFGLVAVEAMSAGLLPVLHGNEAYLALQRRHADVQITDFSEPETAATTIEAAYRRLVEDPQKVRGAVMQAAATHGWADVTQRHIAVYSEALKASRP